MTDCHRITFFSLLNEDLLNLNICTDLVTFPWQEELSYAALLFSSCKKISGNYIFHKTIQHAGVALNKHIL